MSNRPMGEVSRRAWQSKTLNAETRTMSVTAATETPARVFDMRSMSEVNEILLASGFRAAKQVPFLNAHDRGSIQSVIGSASGFGVEKSTVGAEVRFAETDDGTLAMDLYKQGHLTDVSVGYTVDRAVDVPEGKTKKIGDREYSGPVRIATQWTIREISAVPIGADPLAKARGEQGIDPADCRPDAITNQEENGMETKETKDTVQTPSPAPQAPPPVDIEAIKTKTIQEAVKMERERADTITARAKLLGLQSLGEKLVAIGASTDEAIRALLDAFAEKRPAQPISTVVDAVPGGDDHEKTRAAMTDGLLMRAGVRIEKPAAGHEEFRGMTLLRLAEECLRRNGISTRGLSSMEISGKALAMNTRGAYPIAGTTADFPLILANVADNALLKAYQEAPSVWQKIARAATVSDFKQVYRSALSEAPDLDLINEAGEYTEAKFNERGENYRIYPYGKRFTITRVAIVNDAIGAFTRIPQLFGAAAPRKIDELVLSILTTNAAMADGNNLFSVAHLNYTSGAGGAMGTAGQMEAAIAAMQNQKGFGEDTAYLNILPAVCLCPPVLGFTASILLDSAGNPTASYSSAVVNPMAKFGIEVVTHGRLTANSTTRWYLFASPQQYDTIEVGFLNGQQAPMLEMLDQTDVDGRIFHVRLDVGAKAVDWKTMRMNDGA